LIRGFGGLALDTGGCWASADLMQAIVDIAFSHPFRESFKKVVDGMGGPI
jgi:hypothetical protein